MIDSNLIKLGIFAYAIYVGISAVYSLYWSWKQSKVKDKMERVIVQNERMIKLLESINLKLGRDDVSSQAQVPKKNGGEE